MPRIPSHPPTNAEPWALSWDAVDVDISDSNVDADQAPYVLSPQVNGADFLVIAPAANSTGLPSFQLIGATFEFHADATTPIDPTVVYVLDEETQTNIRRQAADNASGLFVFPAIQFDMRGFRALGNNFRWYLACSVLGTGNANTYVIEYRTFSRRPS